VLDRVAKSITCTLLDDDDARQCNNTGTLPSLFSFSSLGARRYYRASRDTPEFLGRARCNRITLIITSNY